ncbi:emp24/gp25L/p24 family/GOLD-domain-containing protein [Sporodiniella umbellata]|nr:emp24/gp25L/p24 family/GOLD-domain-containing protein [Sporodiniella umbellata]
MSSFRFSVFLLLAACIVSTQALYFYLEGSEKKCFIEDLPKETMVIGVYKSEQYSEATREWVENKESKFKVTVDELPANHRIVDTEGSPSGRFTFTSTESGDHAICLSTTSTAWFDNTRTRVTFDMDFDDPTDHHDHHAEGVSGKDLKRK